MIATTTGFLASLLFTLVFLGGAVITGFKAKRKVHLCFVAGAVSMLIATIYFAIELGKFYDLESAGVITPIHMFMAKVNTAAYVLPLLSGLRTIKHPQTRKLHGRIALSVLTMTVFTAITGALMLYWATPII